MEITPSSFFSERPQHTRIPTNLIQSFSGFTVTDVTFSNETGPNVTRHHTAPLNLGFSPFKRRHPAEARAMDVCPQPRMDPEYSNFRASICALNRASEFLIVCSRSPRDTVTRRYSCDRGELCIEVPVADTRTAWCISTPSSRFRVPAEKLASKIHYLDIGGFNPAGGQGVLFALTKYWWPSRRADADDISIIPLDENKRILPAGQNHRAISTNQISFRNTPRGTTFCRLRIEMNSRFIRPDVNVFAWDETTG